MPIFYSAIDILLNATSGEGFGVPIIEATACGTPSVVTKNSAMQYFTWCHTVQPVVSEYIPDQAAFRSWPSVDGIAFALETASLDPPPSYPYYREIAEQYSKDVVAQRWKELIEQHA